MLDDIFIRPVGKSHRRSHHSGWYEKAGFVTPATNPGTFNSSSILVRSVYGKACRVNPRSTPPEASAHAANTASATSPEGRLCPRKMTLFWVSIALIRTMIGCVYAPEVVRCGCKANGCGCEL